MVIFGISHSMHTLNPESRLHFVLKSRIPPFKENKANRPSCSLRGRRKKGRERGREKSTTPFFPFSLSPTPFDAEKQPRPQGAFPWPGKSALGTRLAEKLYGDPHGSLNFNEHNWTSPIPGVQVVERSVQMVGSELNCTRAKRGKKTGDWMGLPPGFFPWQFFACALLSERLKQAKLKNCKWLTTAWLWW